MLKILKVSCGGEERDRDSPGGGGQIGEAGESRAKTPNCARDMKLNSELRTMNHDGQKSTKWAVAVQSKDYEFMYCS